jgi:hypothetical protein
VQVLDQAGDGRGTLEDVVTRLEPLGRFPHELLEIPPGLAQVPHPLRSALDVLQDPRRPERPSEASGEIEGPVGIGAGAEERTP